MKKTVIIIIIIIIIIIFINSVFCTGRPYIDFHQQSQT